MKWLLITLATAFCCILLQPRPARAADLAPASQPSAKLTVAVLDFDAAAPELGRQISTAVASKIAELEACTLVDRGSLTRALQETELSLTGLVAAENAVKVGRLVGARLLVTGRAFVLEKRTFLTAKIIGTETSLVDVVSVSSENEPDLNRLIEQLAVDVSKRIKDSGGKLLGSEPSAPDPLPALSEQLSRRVLPKIAVQVTERHISTARPAGVDPAVDTELKKLLIDCGFTVIEGNPGKLADEGVELIVAGEAISEFSARIGNLVSCSARVEVKLTDRKSGRILFSDRTVVRATDLSENIAGKAALQEGGRQIGLRLLANLAQSLPAKPASPPGSR